MILHTGHVVLYHLKLMKKYKEGNRDGFACFEGNWYIRTPEYSGQGAGTMRFVKDRQL